MNEKETRQYYMFSYIIGGIIGYFLLKNIFSPRKSSIKKFSKTVKKPRKNKRFVKGSKEAKEYMASIRRKKKK